MYKKKQFLKLEKKYNSYQEAGSVGVMMQICHEKLEDHKYLLQSKKIYQKILFALGGPLANFLTAIIIFFMVAMFAGKAFSPAIILKVKENTISVVAINPPNITGCLPALSEAIPATGPLIMPPICIIVSAKPSNTGPKPNVFFSSIGR